MPEEKKTVDIDTSGPEVDVQLPEKEEDKTYENEATVPNNSESADTSEKSDVSADVQESKQEETKEEKVETETTQEKDELKEYSESVQKRIAKLTKKWREAERQKEEAISYAQSIMKAKKEADKKISTLEPSVLKTTEESIKSGMEAAKAKLAAAREANDLGAETEAMSAISELGYKQAKFLEAKNAQEEFNKNKQTEVKTPSDMSQKPFAKTPAPDPKAEAWSEKNEWFGKDSAMTYTAFDLHKKLTEEEGFDPTSDEYYSEIDKRIRLEFPHKFGSNTDKGENSRPAPVQTVASAKRSTKTGRKSVRLTSSEVAIAKKLGVPLEEYAKQKQITKEA